MSDTGLDVAAGPAPVPPKPSQDRWLSRLLRERSVRVAAVGWVAANALVVAVGSGGLPFDWPTLPGRAASERLVETNLALLEVFALMGVVYLLTRRRAAPDLAARAPRRVVARRETVALLAYGVLGLIGGFFLARSFGWHPFGLHLAGTLYGTHQHVEPAEAVVWAAYNLIVYAVAPLIFFRRRYSATALNLTSTNRGNDALVMVVVLLIESVVQVLALKPAILDLSTRQLALGVPLTFVLYLAGAVLPAMVFIYAILVPRYLRLTGSTATTVILAGLTYTLLHLWDAWTVFNSPRSAVLSVIFLLFTYFGPGMIKAVLTVRTGNAWVHVLAYHALAPHTLGDTTHMVEVFDIR
ncbi:MAG TPA: hypothetical protein VKG85_02000 [Actinomycetes bacterium]|nr:hypothetical protein [Actinomycetes bacterium]